MVADWGDEGEIDLLDFFAELTIYTSSACLIGQKFREQLDAPLRAATTTSSSAAPTRSRYVDPYLPTSRASSAATRPASKLVALVQEIMDGRDRQPAQGQGATATCSTC